MGLLVIVSLAATTPPTLSAAGDTAAGYVRLSWTSTADAPYELQSSADARFETATTVYRGAQTASFLSGLPDGTLFFRVRGSTTGRGHGPWSKPLRFDVAHHSTTTAAALFALGAVVFLLTLGFLWREARRTR